MGSANSIWNDLDIDTMITCIKAHVRMTGNPVVVANESKRLLLGYLDPITGKTWHIRIGALAGSKIVGDKIAIFRERGLMSMEKEQLQWVMGKKGELSQELVPPDDWEPSQSTEGATPIERWDAHFDEDSKPGLDK